MMEPHELPDAARSLLKCIEANQWEDAHQWCLDILGAIHDRSKREAAELKMGIERLGFRRI